jgi:hypothetical protein
MFFLKVLLAALARPEDVPYPSFKDAKVVPRLDWQSPEVIIRLKASLPMVLTNTNVTPLNYWTPDNLAKLAPKDSHFIVKAASTNRVQYAAQILHGGPFDKNAGLTNQSSIFLQRLDWNVQPS